MLCSVALAAAAGPLTASVGVRRSGAHLAASILHTAHALGDVEDRTVLDLGCGCGVLSIAAALMGAGHVVSHRLACAAPAVSRVVAAGAHHATLCHVRPQVGVDVDADALQIAASNFAQFEDLHVDLLHADVAQLPRRLCADTVVTCAHAAARRRVDDSC